MVAGYTTVYRAEYAGSDHTGVTKVEVLPILARGNSATLKSFARTKAVLVLDYSKFRAEGYARP